MLRCIAKKPSALVLGTALLLLPAGCKKPVPVVSCMAFSCPNIPATMSVKPGQSFFYAFGPPLLPGTVTYTLISGTMPANLALTTVKSQGQMAGTIDSTLPDSTTYDFTVRIEDNMHHQCDLPFVFTVVSTADPAAYPQILKQAMSPACTATDKATLKLTFIPSAFGQHGLTWSLEQGSTLPAGLVLDPVTGEVDGKASGDFTFSLLATDTTNSQTSLTGDDQLISATFGTGGGGGT